MQGEDRFTFLQGLVTQDIMKLTPTTPLYSLFLTAGGRFFADFFMVEVGDSLFLTPGVNAIEGLQKKFSFYKLRSDVRINLRPDWVVAVSLQRQSLFPHAGIIFQDPRLRELGTVFLGPSHILKEAVSEGLSYESHRLILGVPEGPLDLELEKSIPLENWMDEMNAISWTKGCFLGQELTARTKHVGEVRKKILPFSASDAVFPGDLLFPLTDAEVGRVVSTYYNGQQGFALVKMGEVPEDRKVFTRKQTVSVNLRVPVFIEPRKQT